MRNMKHILFVNLMLIVFMSTVVYAAPTVDGDMSDWDDLNYNEFDGRVYPQNSTEFRINKIGLFINDTDLYFGLDTGFELNYKEDDYTPGDIYLSFSQGGETKGEFGIRFDIDDIQGVNNINGIDPQNIGPPDYYDSDFKIYKDADWVTVNEKGPGGDTPFRVADTTGLEYYNNNRIFRGGTLPMESGDSWATSTETGEVIEFLDNAGGYQRFGGSSIDPNSNTLEGSIQLSTLIDALGNLNTEMGYDVKILWTMSCGNDALEYVAKVPGTNPIPEPGTMLLFGFGLLGISAFGRKKKN